MAEIKSKLQPAYLLCKPGKWHRLAWLPIPVLLYTIVALWVADLRVAIPMPALLWLFAYGSVSIGVIFVVIPAARSFVVNGQLSVLMLGTGMLIMDTGVVTAQGGFARNPDTGFAIYTTSMFLGAFCQFIGVVVTSRRKSRLKHSIPWLAAMYSLGIAVIGLVTWSAFMGWMPVFFIDGQGGTLLRSLVMSMAGSLFILTAGLLWWTKRTATSPFFFWYALGLVMLAAGLAGSMLVSLVDSPLQWCTRFTQVLATIYLCAAVLASLRDSNNDGIPLVAVEETWRKNDFLANLGHQSPMGWILRYGLALAFVVLAVGLRLASMAWVGAGLPPYITFYPATMMVALLAGIGPGIAATVSMGIVAAYWILPPVGKLAIASSADRLGLVIYMSMGLLMSVIAELYRRNRDKAATYEQEMALSKIRETLHQEAEIELRKNAVQLEKANNDLESFSYSVSHDLRAPLRAIDGFSRMILKRQGDSLDEDSKHQFQVIRTNVKTMGNLIDDLLAFSRLGRQEVTKVRLAMDELIRDVWEGLIIINPGRSLVLKMEPMPEPQGDRTLIRQVYSNLLGNAIKFTNTREAAVIEAGRFIQDNEQIYFVRDNGVGFDMKYYDKLFGVFQRLHGQEFKGTGIGLAIVQRIIKRHGGRVWAEGQIDKGATFYFTLPSTHIE